MNDHSIVIGSAVILWAIMLLTFYVMFSFNLLSFKLDPDEVES